VRNGLKLRATGNAVGTTWISQQWMGLLEEVIPPVPRREGLDYARRGQTTVLEVDPGRLDARVQGRAVRPYVTRWHLPVLGDDQWQRIIDAMAAEAFYAAKLLVNEVPPAVDALFASHDLRVLPLPEAVVVECDCGAHGPCTHAAAVGYLFAERLDDDPVAVFALRGMPRVLERLAQARAMRAHGVAAAHAEPQLPSSLPRAKPLEACLDAFWRPGRQLAELQRMPPPHHAPHALLRRLGPSPLPGKFPLVGLLASIYDTVAQSVIHLRDQAERLTGENEPTRDH
jgi:uncharacterized Zn finger protein